MIGTFAFLLLWVLLGLGLFVTAVGRGPRRHRRERESPSRRGRRAVLVAFSAVFVVVGVVVPALVIAGTHNRRQSDRQIFATSCGNCHTLAAAGATGTIGPNLDTLLPTMARVQNALRIGGTGGGRMPAGLLNGTQADAMARYVTSIAGKRNQ